MNTVHIVVIRNLTTDFSDVISRLFTFRIHVSLITSLADESRKAATQARTAQLVPFPYRNRNHPCMEFHAALVTFIYGKLQGIIARRCTRIARETSVPGFIL